MHPWLWFRMGGVVDPATMAAGAGAFQTPNSGVTLHPWGSAARIDRRIDATDPRELTYAELECRRLVMEEVFGPRLAKAQKVAVVDFHTGLGPYGHGERICVHEPGSASLQRAAQWYEDDITSPALGTSSSVELHGCNELGMEQALAGRELTTIALEYGTIPTPEVRIALCADNWLHRHGEVASAQGEAIKAQIRAAFYPDRDDWKDLVWERAVETLRLALTGLSEG